MDLVTAIGDPFPPHSHTNTSKDSEGKGGRREGREGREGGEGAREGGADQERGGGGYFESETNDEGGPLIRVVMRPHEGVEGRKPFRVEPSQMVNYT